MPLKGGGGNLKKKKTFSVYGKGLRWTIRKEISTKTRMMKKRELNQYRKGGGKSPRTRGKVVANMSMERDDRE